MKISDCMKHKVISSLANVSIRSAANMLVQNHIGTLPIVDDSACLIGLVRARDLITLAMPDFIKLVEDVDFVHDFGAVEDEEPGDEILCMPVSQIMSEPISAETTAGLVRALALLQEHELNDLPVVDVDKHLVGIASYVDIGVALMSNWNLAD
ncbi:MAG: HPP family protein [Anaerolineaceae bacterium]